MTIKGETAIQLAELWELPHNENCCFEFSLEAERKWVSFDGGFDYEIDGYTHEQEWPLPNNIKESCNLIKM